MIRQAVLHAEVLWNPAIGWADDATSLMKPVAVNECFNANCARSFQHTGVR